MQHCVLGGVELHWATRMMAQGVVVLSLAKQERGKKCRPLSGSALMSRGK